MEERDYSEMLKKVKSSVQKREEKKRFQIPKPEIITEGKLTIIKNFKEIVDVINRDESHVYKFLIKQFGLSGDISDGRLIFKGKPPEGSIEKAFQEYLRTYVQCYECGNYDTEMIREFRNEVIRCKACGAERPLHAHKEIKYSEEKIEERKTYELEVTDLNRDGDGISIKGDITVIIPGAKKGQKVTVRIDRIRKNYALGILVKKN
ncbi:MAG: translation initiation factor IF-2 subunit beta [Candidatus Thermoplasmatota archaeon]|nr:translation initiation factor IF-2 subunit beta [Candidatus Thermoplasmatota archaeon]MCL5929840.1 translation initiation factor IF-2 subunit beta [Candidatus Thermoplasmatota archaeon]